jgi:hypothetical protein
MVPIENVPIDSLHAPASQLHEKWMIIAS